jgi:hypothetical protein
MLSDLPVGLEAVSGPTGAPVGEIENARERLARCLFDEMESLDPSVEELSWDTMSGVEKELFRSSVNALLREKTDLLLALNLSNNNLISCVGK